MNGSVLPTSHQRQSSRVDDLKATGACLKVHLNSLWSIWYGVCVTAFNGYIVLQCSKRYFDYQDLKWPSDLTPSPYELQACIALTGFSVLLIPFFLCCAVFKVGNLANDGFKLGRNVSSCTAAPANGVLVAAKNTCQRMWQHCGPTAPIFHLILSFCVLLPKLVMEARTIQAGFLPQENVWKTDLDFLIPHREPLVVLNFTPSANITNSTTLRSSQPRNLPLSVAAGQEIVLEDNTNIGTISIEFLNYAAALLIYSIRYPAVFWSTNKYFGILFSAQLLINSAQCLLMHAGVSILYKIHVIGNKMNALPYLNIRLNKWIMRIGTPFILNKEVTLALYVTSVFLIMISSLVLYLYGYGRMNAFLNREKARRVISMRDGGGRTWGYFTHCAALCVLVAIGICEAPLLYDFTLVYRGSLDSVMLAVILSSILHLFVWVLLWLILTLKQHWEFKLRIIVGHAAVRSARSIKLITDVQLAPNVSSDFSSAPLLVVGHGKTYAITETPAKKAVMGAIQKTTLDKKMKIPTAAGASNRAPSDDGEEQIYWLRPKSRTPRNSPDSSSSETRFGWFSKKKTGEKMSVEAMAMIPKNNVQEDNGDYVRLRELPSSMRNRDDSSSEDKLLESVRNESVTYACTNKDLYEDPSPLLTPEPRDNDDLPPPPPELSTINCGRTSDHRMKQTVRFPPDCLHEGKLHRSDSGVPAEEAPSHSDSEISNGSPPDRTNSETSSGVHSSSSRESDKVRFQEGMAVAARFSQQWIQRIQQNGNIQQPYCNRYKPQQHYAIANKTAPIIEEEGTVMIRRNPGSMGALAKTDADEDMYGRCTNMRMTSFSDKGDGKVSATLPHYPTQPGVAPHPHCSTMPLNVGGMPPPPPPCQSSLSNGCGSFPRQHSSIPLHHNGVRLRAPAANPYLKRIMHGVYPSNEHCPAAAVVAHHTFSSQHIPMHGKFISRQNGERDSANFSIASSGDSDMYNGH